MKDYKGTDKSLIKGISISVMDEGVGIPEKELEEIFDAFTQSTRTKTGAGGSGLGLSICAEIINLHNGKIWAENNPDKGACFNFILPTANQAISNTSNRQRIDLKANILIIDDEEACLNSMGLLLHETGCNLIKLEGGIPGLEYLRSNPSEVDLILLDLMMPDMYGMNVLKAIKTDHNLKDIPVILQSGTHDQAEVYKAFELGITGYISKPYKKDKILPTIQEALNLN
jgi:two-component system sensor histidine kinase ChiS